MFQKIGGNFEEILGKKSSFLKKNPKASTHTFIMWNFQQKVEGKERVKREEEKNKMRKRKVQKNVTSSPFSCNFHSLICFGCNLGIQLCFDCNLGGRNKEEEDNKGIRERARLGFLNEMTLLPSLKQVMWRAYAPFVQLR